MPPGRPRASAPPGGAAPRDAPRDAPTPRRPAAAATPSTPTVPLDETPASTPPAPPGAGLPRSLRSPRHQRKRKNNAVTSTLPSSTYDLLLGGAQGPGAGALCGAGAARPTGGGDPLRDAKQCKNCNTESTPFWRKDKTDGKPLCNACGLYLAKNDAHRPRGLWGPAGT